MNPRIISRIALGTGIALLVSSLAGLLVAGSKPALVQAALGLAAVVFYFATNRGALGRTFSGRATWFYGTSAAAAVALLGALAALNFVAVRKQKSWDLTAEGIHTLAPDTVQTLRRLEDEVRVTAFFGTGDPAHGAARELLERYQAESDHLVVEFVDPWAAPDLVREKNIRQGGPRVIFTHGANEARASQISEEAFTNALLQVLREGQKKVYVVQGHGERDLDDLRAQEAWGQAAHALRSEGVELEKLHLTSGEIPEDAAALIVAAPQRPWFEPEVESLRTYVAGGGRLLVAFEPGHADPGLEALLEEHGFVFEEGMIVDPLSRLIGGGAAIPVVQNYAAHDILRDFDLATLFPSARAVAASADATPRPTLLALSNPSAWAELDLANPQARADEGEKRGPLGIVAAVEKAGSGEKKSRVVAIGDADFASNQFLAAGGNADLFLNTVNWLVSQEERITIRPRTREASRLVLTEADARFLNLASINVLPMLILAAGMSVWLVRRAR